MSDPDHDQETSGGGQSDPVPDAPPDSVDADATGHERVRVSVPEMDCASCAGKVEASVSELDGVVTIQPYPTTGTLVVEYDPATTDRAAVVDRVTAAGYAVVDEPDEPDEPDEHDDAEARLSVPEMDCASCAGKVETALVDVAGVTGVDTRPTTGTVVLTYDPDRTDARALVAAVEGAGYDVTGIEDDDGGRAGGDEDGSATDSVWRSARALKTAASAVFAAVGLLAEFGAVSNPVVTTALGHPVTGADVLFLAAVAVGGQAILRNGYYSVKARNLDIDLLMSVAIVGALTVSLGFGEGLYLEAATLAVLFSVAELLERYSMDRARESLRELMDLSPAEATVRRDGEERTVPVEEVVVGDVVVVRPGEKIPVDGTVVAGDSAVDQAAITGESVPVDKSPGDGVYAGTIVEGGYLEVETTTAPGDDTLSRVVELVEDAQADRTEREQFVERFAGYYTPIVVSLAVLTAVVPPLFLGAPWVQWFVYGLTLIVLACPCAFVISTPVSVVSGITSAAKQGVLVKGGSHLEAMGDVEAVAFDKTGTLTRGELAVTDVLALNGNTETDVLRCARGLERRSEHPIGQAIVEHAADQGPEREVDDFESITGKGVRADIDGTPHVAGKPGLFEELGFDLHHVHATSDRGTVTARSRQLCERNDCLDLLEETVPRLEREGKTVVLVGTEDELEGVIAVADEVRPEARRTVERLRQAGLHTVMLTGDNERTAAAIADAVGVDDYRAALLPEEKVEAVRGLAEEYPGGVAMVGDGVNDAPALATATVGIAMGAAGTDAALETADVALLADDLSKLPYLRDLSVQARAVIRQNVWTSLGAKALLALGVPFGLVPIWAAVLVGDAGMTTAVTANAMRLSRVSPDEPTDAGTEDGGASLGVDEATRSA